MALDERELAKERRIAALRLSALALALHRLGGRIEFTETDYLAVVEGYGGPPIFNIRIEVVREPGRADRVVASLERKPPKQGDLPA